jgi:hypothetical protein
MSKTDAEWIEILGDRYCKNVPLKYLIEEYEAELVEEAEKAKRRAPPGAITKAELERRLESLCETVGQWTGGHLKKLEKRIEELEAKQLSLGGVWKEGERYRENTLVSYQGGLWLARANTTAKPGSGRPLGGSRSRKAMQHERRLVRVSRLG